jgi:hypothetical protein
MKKSKKTLRMLRGKAATIDEKLSEAENRERMKYT